MIRTGGSGNHPGGHPFIVQSFGPDGEISSRKPTIAMIGLFAMHDQQLAHVSRPASRCPILRGTELGLKNCVAGDSRVSPPDPADYLAESLRGGRTDAPDCHRGLVALSLAPGIRFGLNLEVLSGSSRASGPGVVVSVSNHRLCRRRNCI